MCKFARVEGPLRYYYEGWMDLLHKYKNTFFEDEWLTFLKLAVDHICYDIILSFKLGTNICIQGCYKSVPKIKCFGSVDSR